MATKSSSSAPLLDRLPAELRNQTYSLVLTFDNAIDVDPESINSRAALLQTCTQIRSEASKIFYTTNTFRITWTAGGDANGHNWLGCIAKDMVPALHLEVQLTVPFEMQQEIRPLVSRRGSRNLTGRGPFKRDKLMRPVKKLAQDILSYGLWPAQVEDTQRWLDDVPEIPRGWHTVLLILCVDIKDAFRDGMGLEVVDEAYALPGQRGFL